MKIRHDFAGGEFYELYLATAKPLCFRRYDSFDSASIPATASNFSTIFSTGTLVYPAWHITWEASDVPTLSPAPPEVTDSRILYDWRPGDPRTRAPLSTTSSVSSTSSSGLDSNLYTGLFAGIPVGLVVLTLCLLAYRIVTKPEKVESNPRNPPISATEANDDISLVEQNRTGKSNLPPPPYQP